MVPSAVSEEMFIAVERENHALGGGLLDSTAVIVHTPIGGPSVPLPERLFGDRTRSRTPEPFFGADVERVM